jgi:isoamylase
MLEYDTLLGSRLDAEGAEFAVTSAVADAVELCLFDAAGAETRHALSCDDGTHWYGRVDGVRAGQRYGFRVHGPWDPSAGLRCNAAKLLLDPYARAIDGTVTWHPAVFGHAPGNPDVRDDADSAPYVPRSVVCASEFDWGGDSPPRTALADSIVYELHVKGFTRRLEAVPEPLRGTYAGLGHPATVAHLTRLGITAVELLPVHQFVHDQRLLQLGLSNYWGYQSIGFFAPHNGYAASAPEAQPAEFKAMVAALHAAGIEVILDVVFNHTAEGNEWGPTLCFRGLDNAAYYRLTPDGRHYVDDTGTGNTVDAHRPAALRLIMDSLRYWVQEMHVDGFRFDLAATLGRATSDFDRFGAFLDAVGQDPVLARVKLIAEPWDLGDYEVGGFPTGWSEWNGRYRDDVRDFWRSVDGKLDDFATRLSGSSDVYGHGGRRPTASINFVTAHDGFTLRDLVSFDGKHNDANGEGNRDGTDDNRSWNCGVEGPTGDPGVLALRACQQRNLLATLLLSEGVPMLLGGDELGRTQGGNNNAYCQDNETSWIDWAAADEELVAFVARLCAIRRAHPVFRRRQFFRGVPARAGGRDDLDWLRPDGAPMTPADWANPQARAIAAALGDEPFLLLVNGWWEPLAFTLPPGGWSALVDTAGGVTPRSLEATVTLVGRSLMLLHGANDDQLGREHDGRGT